MPKSAIPRGVWTLGFVSLLMDLSSELIHSLLPVFLVSVLGASVLSLGLIEGAAEATAMIVKVFSGALSDFVGRRKGLLLFGYGLAAASKPLFPLAASVETVLAARFLDRVGKGIRGAPRDALLTELAPAEIRGACFGLRQSMDTLGAFGGPLAAIGLMLLWHSHIRAVLWAAVAPAAIAVALIVAGVHEPGGPIRPMGHRFRSPLHPALLARFPAAYWWVVSVGAVFAVARFSEAFLVLRAQQAGLPLAWVPLVMVAMSLFYSLSAYPAGVLSDRIERRHLLAIGLVLLVAADLVLAAAASPVQVLAGAAIWGLHLGFTQGVLATMVADVSPAELRGTAFGFFNLASGLCLLPASIVAGWLWDRHGAPVTFYTGAALALLALLLQSVGRHRLETPRIKPPLPR